MIRALSATILAASAALCVPTCSAADEPGEWDVMAGFTGVRRTGSWTPLVVSAPEQSLQPGAMLNVWVEDSDGQWVRSPAATETVAAGRSLWRFCVRFGTPSGRVLVEPPYRPSRDQTDNAAAATPVGALEHRCGPPVPSTERLLLVVGDLPAAAAAARLLQREGGRPFRVQNLEAEPRDAAAPIPASARDFDAADAIVVCGGEIGGLPAKTVTAIDGWVRRGGRLVLAAGATAVEITAAEDVATSWLPGRVTGLVPLRRFATIEAYARAGGLDARAAAGTQVPAFAAEPPLDGIVDVAMDAGGSRPLVVRRPLGLGCVTWIGADLDADPFRDWPGLETLLVGLLDGRRHVDADSVAVPPAGVADLAGQLRAALERFAGTAPVPFEVVAAIGLLYVASLYPLDWWLASRGGRPWISWITLPVMATAFTVLAWVTGDWWGRGAPAACRTAEVIDIDAAGGMVRGSSWAAVRSPDNARLDVAVAASANVAAAPVDAALSWLADTGTTLGGVDAGVQHPSLATADYGYGAGLADLEAVPIAAGATRVFEAEWFATRTGPTITSTLARTEEGTLRGAVAHHLPFPLERCQLAHGGWLYDVGTLAPGQQFDAGGRGPRSLSNAVRRAKARREREAADGWDPTTGDVERILEVAGFHGAAGGIGYTLMEAGRLQRLDLSRLLVANRAVLVGDAGTGHRASGWQVRPHGAADAPWPTQTVSGRYRIVIPLAPEAAEPAP
jgi:hypothetical protein